MPIKVYIDQGHNPSGFNTGAEGNGYYERKRRQQAEYWMYESINEALKNNFYENSTIASRLEDYKDAVLEGKMDSFMAAGELMDLYNRLKA